MTYNDLDKRKSPHTTREHYKKERETVNSQELYDIIKDLEKQVEKDKQKEKEKNQKKESISFLTPSPKLSHKNSSNQTLFDPTSRSSSFSGSPHLSPQNSPERFSTPIDDDGDIVMLRKRLFLLESNYQRKCQDFSTLSSKHQNLRNGYKNLLSQVLFLFLFIFIYFYLFLFFYFFIFFNFNFYFNFLFLLNFFYQKI